MNENKTTNTCSTSNVCRVCLNTVKHLYPMSNEHIKLYITLVDEIVYKEYNMRICMICQWMLQKFAKFKHQCLAANHLLNEITYMDSKSHLSEHKTLTSSHNITQTNLATHTYIPSLHTLQNDTHYSVHTHNNDISHNYPTCNTLHQTMYTHVNIKKTEDDQEYNDQDSIKTFDIYMAKNDNHNYMTINDKYTNDSPNYTMLNDNHTNDDDDFTTENDTNENNKYTNENDKYTNENDKYTNENCKYTNENGKYTNENDKTDDEDELPLLLISNKKKERTKQKKMKKKIKEKMINPEKLANIQESDKQSTDNKKEEIGKSTKSKKVLRDGFTSRMVQETNEYVVIKLTKEQVLEEMAERSRTVAYTGSPFKCEKCVKGFNFQDVLDTHMEKHSLKNGTFVCDMCGQRCPSAVSLRGHIKSHTTRYKCKVCGAVRAARQHLVEHHATHSGAARSYRCLHCSFTTGKRTVMQRHARGHAAGEPHACDKCGKLFKTIDYLRLHTARHDKSSRFKCSLCPDTFVYHSLLRRHVQCVHERKEFYCVECDVQFKCAESLRVHFKRAKKHRDPTVLKHACPSCPARFHSSSSLATHLTNTHDESKQHACTLCPRTYSTRDAVRSHAWRVHARGEARAVCPHCHVSFARKSVLMAHIRARRGACGARGHEIEEPQYENKTEV